MKWFFTFTLSLILILSTIYVYFYSTAAMADDRIHIGIIDTGVRPGHEEWYCKDAAPKDFTGEGVYDTNGHGSNIAGIVAQFLKPSTHCLIIVKFYHNESYKIIPGPAIAWAVAHGAKYLNLSFSGPVPDTSERLAIKYALEHGVQVAVAAGNDSKNLGEKCDAYPACYTFTSGALFAVVSNRTDAVSNYGGPVTASEDGTNVEGWFGIKMTGTSQATALYLGKLIRSEFRTGRH